MEWLDRETSLKQKISPLVLMENAGEKSFLRLVSLFGPLKGKSILIVAGGGNNGGDGLVLARYLFQEGSFPTVFFVAEPPAKKEAKMNYEIFDKLGGRILKGEKGFSELPALLQKSDLIVDAIYGTGLSRPITGRDAEVIQKLNQSGKTVIALDIPSGISADTGKRLGEAVQAQVTLAYGLPKKGHFLFPGADCRGELFVEEIGIPSSLIHQAGIKTELLEGSYIREIFPIKRKKESHKGNFGHLLVLAGSRGKRGAGALCCKAALRSGAGLVTWGLPESLDSPDAFIPEVMTLPLPETIDGTISLKAEDEILAAVRQKDGLAIGPGLGGHPETRALLKRILPQLTLPIIIDADGINLIAEEKDLLKKLNGPILLTPHPGELGRFLGIDSEAVQNDRIALVVEAAKNYRVYFLLKGAYTLIAAPDETVSINPTGNPGMATAGTGDVLTGMIAALAVQGIPLLMAAQAGVYLHGLAGDLAAGDKGEVGMISSDLIEKIPDAIQQVRKGQSRV